MAYLSWGGGEGEGGGGVGKQTTKFDPNNNSYLTICIKKLYNSKKAALSTKYNSNFNLIFDLIKCTN